MNQFAVVADQFGNILCNVGYVINTTAATTEYVELGSQEPIVIANEINNQLRPVTGSVLEFLGGSGDSFDLTGTLADSAPLGMYARIEEDIWQYGQFTLTGDPATGAELADADDVVATITGAYTGFPDGTYTLTTYGEDTYNGGTAATIDGEQEAIATTQVPAFISATASSVTEIIANTGTVSDGEYNLTSLGLAEKIAWSGTDWELLDEFGAVIDTGPSTQYDPTFDYDGGVGIGTISVVIHTVKSASIVDYGPSTIPIGNYTNTDWCEWTSDDDPDFVITVNVDGTADISDSTDIIAERTDEILLQSQGVYRSTTYGADTYNLGAPFIMTIGFIPAMPLSLWVWVEIALSSGTFNGASGPFVGAELPANSSTKKVIPIYNTNGAGEAKQFTFGPVIWT